MLSDQGDIPLGEIPEPLKYDRPYEITTISNGIKVMTEPSQSEVAAVGVFIGAGSRHEKIENSGEAHFLEHLHFKGSKRRTRYGLETEVENRGNQLNAYTSREFTLYHMLSFKSDVPQSVDVLGDMLCNSQYNRYHVEAEKSTIWQELQATNDDTFETLMENVYFNVYRDHMMGLPILGEINNIHKITREMIVGFHKRMYYGENMIIIGTGNVEHQMLVDLAEQHFGKLQRTNGGAEILNLDTPAFTPGYMYVRDDIMQNQALGVFYNAPCWKDPDFFAFLLLQRILGNYSLELKAELFEDVMHQPNLMHTLAQEIPGLERYDAIYSPYTDCGVFGHYFFGDPRYAEHMSYTGATIGEVMSGYLTDVEVTRAKYRLYHELLSVQSASDAMQQYGP